MVKEGSAPRTLSKSDWLKLGKSFGLGLAGVVLTYTAEFAAGNDFGDWTPVIVGVVTVAVNGLRLWVTDTRKDVR